MNAATVSVDANQTRPQSVEAREDESLTATAALPAIAAATPHVAAASTAAPVLVASAPASTTALPSASKRTTITLTFEGEADQTLYQKIVADAVEEERPVSVNLLRFVRKHYGKV